MVTTPDDGQHHVKPMCGEWCEYEIMGGMMKRRVSFADRCMRYKPSHGAPPGLPAACAAAMRSSHPPPAAVGLRYTSGCASLL